MTDFVHNNLKSELPPAFTLDVVDIATFNLPVFDESVIPANVPKFASFSHPHSIAWSSAIAPFDAYVLITACYNAGPPGGIKNAIDYLFNEIKGKPWLIISYGIMGGGKAAESLKGSLQAIGCKVVDTMPQLAFSKKGPLQFGMSEDVLLTMQGKIGEKSLDEWNEKRGEILKGFEELKACLMDDGETQAA